MPRPRGVLKNYLVVKEVGDVKSGNGRSIDELRGVLLYCPTKDMLADFFSKPQQGSLYARFRDMVMGITPVPPVEDPSLTCPTSQERPGNRNLAYNSWE
ncbi:unnamed protein product [Cylindrotheca closterium]|uniref:Uncharacterized protein n=1 Tax=Cylindrotheca closterium TaxID=2856 RepID=A0AAD2CSR6_9STRA|nr:unnamed protein product [Cylindrotheca closterium]